MKSQDFMSGISEYFSRPPQELQIFLICLAVFITILILSAVIQRLSEKAKLAKILEIKYNNALHRFELSEDERRLVESLAQFLKNRDKKYLLFENQQLFNHCLFQLRINTTVPKEPLGTLMNKLKFKITDSFHDPVSSRQLPAGKPVLLITDDGKKLPALVEEVTQKSLVLSIDPHAHAPVVGTDLSVFTNNDRGLVTFIAMVGNVRENIISLTHSDHLKSIQRRANFRKQVTVPIYIKREGADMPVLKSEILDLSAGGMSVKNPSLSFTRGDDCKISFAPDTKLEFDLYGEIIRVSKGGNILHIRFGHFPEAMEDEIIRFLNKKREESDGPPS
ncbi:MAG: PilZ domain-containing protein [Spirochaetaceae bacterium]|nr:MAG: PilZ domain-containing protein [Spirochaetaceae bacterium]